MSGRNYIHSFIYGRWDAEYANECRGVKREFTAAPGATADTVRAIDAGHDTDADADEDRVTGKRAADEDQLPGGLRASGAIETGAYRVEELAAPRLDEGQYIVETLARPAEAVGIDRPFVVLFTSLARSAPDL
jgi:hypothetical protein